MRWPPHSRKSPVPAILRGWYNILSTPSSARPTFLLEFMDTWTSSVPLFNAGIFLYTPFGARAKSSRWERSRLQAYVALMRGGVDEHQHVVADALNRSEWSAKSSRSEREADHERRSVVMF